jgi:hypothetical protein
VVNTRERLRPNKRRRFVDDRAPWSGAASATRAAIDAVHRLTTVGDSIEPACFWVSDKPAKRIARRLAAARSAFADAVSQAAEIAEQVALDPAHSDGQAHLEVLSRQASQLAGTPARTPSRSARSPSPRRDDHLTASRGELRQGPCEAPGRRSPVRQSGRWRDAGRHWASRRPAERT